MLRTLALLLSSLLFAATSYADVVFNMDQKDTATETTGRSEGKVKNQNIRLDYYEDGEKLDGTMVFRGDTGNLIMINHEDKTYMVLDEATIESIGTQMNEAMKQMQEALKDVPPDQRDMVEKMMKERMPGMAGGEQEKPEVKKAGSGKVGDYSCTKYDVYKGDTKIMQHCVTPWSKITGGEEMKNAMITMGDFMDNMAEKFSSTSGFAGAGVQGERNMFKLLRKMDGFPVQTIMYSDGEQIGESNLVSSKEETVEAAEFEPPADYKLQKIDTGP